MFDVHWVASSFVKWRLSFWSTLPSRDAMLTTTDKKQSKAMKTNKQTNKTKPLLEQVRSFGLVNVPKISVVYTHTDVELAVLVDEINGILSQEHF